MTPRRVRCSALASALLAGCMLNSGVDPTPATLNFPIALALSRAAPGEAPSHLFVANSNFDLRANQGTLMAFDLNVVDERIALCTGDDPCEIDVLDGSDGFTPIVASEVALGSHMEGLVINPDGDRLYLPVRSDRNLTFVDWDGARLTCGSDESTSTDIPICGPTYREGSSGGVASDRELTLIGDPVDVAVGSLEDIGGAADSGDFVLLALRDGGVALFIDQPMGAGTVPELAHIAEGFSSTLVTMTLQPGTGVAWLTSALVSQVDRVAVSVDLADRDRSFVYDFGPVQIDGLDDGTDARDIEFDPDQPGERAFLLSRRPEAVVTLELDGQSNASIGDIYEVGTGPSRIALARIASRMYVLASSYDARKLFVIDPEYGALIATIGGFSGPFEVVADEERQVLYMADFSTSVVRIVDLSPLETGDAPVLVATLGEPTPVQSFVNR
jgi:DNA-binding beta-propeller fold protein YncE